MIIKSNTPLSDNEMRQVKNALINDDGTIKTTEAIADIFPYTDVNISNGVVYIGKPPWDLSQEMTI